MREARGRAFASTGVGGLDEILGGGYMRGHLTLLAGNPGSGKTTMASQFLYNGAKEGEPGIYMNFVEPKSDFYKNMEKLGMEFEKLEDEGLFEYIEAPSFVDAESLAGMVADTMGDITRMSARRFVIDSISAITGMLTKPETRSMIHTGLLRPLKSMGVTTVLVAELPYGGTVVGHGIEEFLVDDVIILETKEEKGLLKRTFRIPKSRGVEVRYYAYEFVIAKGGVHVMKPLDPRFRGKLEKEKASTGVEGLDKLLYGGIRYNSNVLVVGPEGIGKSMLLMTLACTFSRRGETVVYVSLEESKDQIMSLIQEICGGSEITNINVFATPPNAFTVGQWLYQTREANERIKPGLVLIDGVAALEKHFGEGAFITLMRDFTLLTKGSYQILVLSAIPRVYDALSTLADVIIRMWYDDDRRKVRVIKTRGSNCDIEEHEFDITDKGIRVKLD